MFDLRYHVVSLAAVFVALVLGILVGVGISESGSVGDSERQLLELQIADLNRRLEAQNRRTVAAERDEEAARTIIDAAYPLLMHNRLVGKEAAVVFVGPSDDRIGSAVEQTFEHAGGPPPLRLRALKVPVEAETISDALSSPLLEQFAGPDKLEELGSALAAELVEGGDTPLWDALSTRIVQDQVGTLRRPVDGVVVARTAEPQQGPTAALLRGLYAGLARAGVPAVGVETTATEPSAVPTYTRAGLSTVDSVDLPVGRLALAVLLEGGPPGHYGVKPSAEDGILPAIELPPSEPRG